MGEYVDMSSRRPTLYFYRRVQVPDFGDRNRNPIPTANMQVLLKMTNEFVSPVSIWDINRP